MTDRLLIADASQCTPAEFLRAVETAFAPTPTLASERADAARTYIAEAWKAPREEAPAIRARYAERLAEIDERYAAVERMKLPAGWSRVAA
jgi:hypothetical protein